jgi:arylsulfatase
MTSLWVRDHSVGWMNGSTRLDGEWTLAERFAEAGYDTAAFVGNMMLSPRVGLDAGFDIYDHDLQQAELNRPEIRERTAARTTRRALAWLALEHARPWFLWVHYQDPHGPYTPPDDHAELFDLREDDEDPLPRLDKNRGERGIPAYQSLPGLDFAGQYASRYAGEIHFFDYWLGVLLEAVDGESIESVVLLTADHGESFGEEGWWFSHGFRTTPDQIHVPFMVRAPSLEPGRRTGLAHHVDVAPTLLDLAGLDTPAGARGLALARVRDDDGPFSERIVFADVGFEASAYQGRRFMRTIIEGDSRGSGSFQWSSTRDWERVPSKDSTRASVERYLKTPTDLVRVDRLDPDLQAERLEQLRALGYVEVGEGEEMPPDDPDRSE